MPLIPPNPAFFQRLHQKLIKQHKWGPKGVADYLGIGATTLKKMMEGRPVSMNKIEAVARTLGCQPNELILTSRVFTLPADPSFYESLTHGYFIDHARTPDNTKAAWYEESIALKRVDGTDGTWEWFSGSITNSKHGHFKVRACLIQGKTFTILASNASRKDAFTASFPTSRCPESSPSKQVLCGIWSGVDHVSRMAVYRMFCSKEPLTGKELSELLHSVRIVSKFEDDEMAEKPKRSAIKAAVRLKQTQSS